MFQGSITLKNIQTNYVQLINIIVINNIYSDSLYQPHGGTVNYQLTDGAAAWNGCARETNTSEFSKRLQRVKITMWSYYGGRVY